MSLLIRCEFCLREFTRTYSLHRHTEKCLQKKLRDFELHIEEQQTKYETEIQHKQQVIESLHEEHLQTRRQDQHRHEMEMAVLREQYEEKLDAQTQLVKMYQEQIFEIAKQPKSTSTNTTNYTNTQLNQRTLNVVQQLAPYDLTREQIMEILTEKFTEEVFLAGPDKIVEMTVNEILMCPATGKPKLLCTDASRKIFRYITSDSQEIQSDVRFERTREMLARPLSMTNMKIYTDCFMKNDPDDFYHDQWYQNDKFIADESKFPDKVHQVLHLRTTRAV